jgi:hypothetical protein
MDIQGKPPTERTAIASWTPDIGVGGVVWFYSGDVLDEIVNTKDGDEMKSQLKTSTSGPRQYYTYVAFEAEVDSAIREARYHWAIDRYRPAQQKVKTFFYVVRKVLGEDYCVVEMSDSEAKAVFSENCTWELVQPRHEMRSLAQKECDMMNGTEEERML